MLKTLANKTVLPIGLRFTKSQFLRLTREMAKRQFWHAARIRSFQWHRLQEVVAHCVSNVDYYRESFSKAGLSGTLLKDFQQFLSLPVTTKSVIRKNFPDRMIANRVEGSDWKWTSTRGTSDRLMAIQCFRKRDQIIAAEMLSLTEDSKYRYGKPMVYIPPDACNALCGVEGLRETSVVRHLVKMLSTRKWREGEAISDLRGLVMNNWIINRTILPPIYFDQALSLDEIAKKYINELRRLRPKMLKALPEYLSFLAGYLESHPDSSLRIPLLRPMGALMSQFEKDRVARAFGGQVREDYGSAEIGPMAFDCHLQNGMHLMTDQYYFELVDENGDPQTNGIGNLLVTDLNNYAMPMIRYEIGDLARIDYAPCACGRTTPRIFVEGRVQSSLSAAGRILTDSCIRNFFQSQFEISQFQVTESENGDLEVAYVAPGREVCKQQMAKQFGQLVGSDRFVRIRQVSVIKPAESGKFIYVKSSSDRRSKALV